MISIIYLLFITYIDNKYLLKILKMLLLILKKNQWQISHDE